MAASLTICIPAYRSESFIAPTLQSVADQTFTDFVVDIAVEPPAGDTLNACQPFLHDRRFRATANSELLGWAGNVQAMLRRVSTPYFFVLPHDDILHPDYITTLLGRLIERPDACVAYGDMVCFGHLSFRKWLHLTEAPLFDRLMSFFLGGAEAVPWRGVTRSSVRDGHDFPTDGYDGFAVECEWALHLLMSGAAHHVARPLYFKRIHEPGRFTASRERIAGRSRQQLLAALDDHRARMIGAVREADLMPAQRDTVELAVEAAMLRRHMTFGMGPLSQHQCERSDAILAAAGADLYGKLLKAMTLLVLSQHASIEDDVSRALDLANAAVESDPQQWEALLHLSRLHLNGGRTIAAFEAANRACSLAPDAGGLRELLAECAAAFDRDFKVQA